MHSADSLGIGSETHLHLIVPSDDLDCRRISSILRLFESLIVLRSMAPRGKPNNLLFARYRLFSANEAIRQISHLLDTTDLPRLSIEQVLTRDAESTVRGMPLNVFEEWIQSDLLIDEHSLLPLERISRGSYEFIFQAVNLAAVLGLQDFNLLKDSLQWVCSALKELLPKHDSAQTTVGIKGGPQLRLTPAVLSALSGFDEIEIEEETTLKTRRLKLKLSRKSSEPLAAEVASEA